MGELILMERAVAARSAAGAVGRSAGRRGAPGGLRAGTGLRERGRDDRAAGLQVQVASLPEPTPHLGRGRAIPGSVALAAPAAERWSERPTFFFDLSCPFSYLAAERVERLLGHVEWVPVPSWGSRGEVEEIVQRAALMARAARLPLVWPDAFPAPAPRAMRAAAYAAEMGAGARFGLAALRLAFCGGFDLDKPSVLGDVAAAAGLSTADCRAAATEDWRDDELQSTATLLSSMGVTELPVIGVDGRWFDGLGGLTEAAAWLRQL